MDLGLKNKTALVLGSSKGLGRSVALTLAEEGANVVICGRDTEALKEVERASSSLQGSIYTIPCDLNSAEERIRLVDLAREKLGYIEILVTNSGGPPPGHFDDCSSSDWRQFFEQLFIGTADVIQQVLPDMKQNGRGAILMITSVTLKEPVDNLIASNAVRTSLLGLMKSLSNELGPLGIRVNTLMPGFTLTNRLKSLIGQNPAIQEVADQIPLKRFGKPEEFGATAAFLVSEKASYITGTAIAVDGGWIKGY